MLQLLLLRTLAPRAFQLINWLGLTFVFISILAIASGMIDHGRNQETRVVARAEETR